MGQFKRLDIARLQALDAGWIDDAVSIVREKMSALFDGDETATAPTAEELMAALAYELLEEFVWPDDEPDG
jgi:hypothetical protein